MKKIKCTYFVKGNKVLGFIDTANIGHYYGDHITFETMDFMFLENGKHTSETYCNERTTDAASALAVHDAWVTILCNRLGASPVVTVFMDDEVIDTSVNGTLVRMHIANEKKRKEEETKRFELMSNEEFLQALMTM